MISFSVESSIECIVVYSLVEVSQDGDDLVQENNSDPTVDRSRIADLHPGEVQLSEDV